jgi:uncharacterized protein YegL
MSTYVDQIIYGGEDFFTNPEPRCPVLLLLDCSGSMSGDPIAELNAGLKDLKNDLDEDPFSRKRVELAVMSFGGTVTLVNDFTTVDNWQAPTLTTTGDTPLGKAVRDGLTLLRKRKDAIREHGIELLRPWVFLITDGAPTDTWKDLPPILASEAEQKAYLFYAVGVQGANFDVLKELSPSHAPLRLVGLQFKDLFKWLSSSLSKVGQSKPGDKVTLDPTTGWGVIEV